MERIAHIEFNSTGNTMTPQVGTLRCDKAHHEKNYRKYICPSKDCSKPKLNCAHCYIEEHIGHNDIKTTVDEFEIEFKKKYEELSTIITELGLSRFKDPKENELFEIIKKFDQMKEDFCEKIEELKNKVLDDFQKLVFTTEVENVRDLARKVVENNSILQITDFKGITEEEFLKFLDMYVYTFQADENLCGNLNVVQTNVRVCYGRLLSNMEKFRIKMFESFDTNVIPVMEIYIDDNFAAGRYKIYHKGCDDFPLLKFVPIFPCCDKAYTCAKCHDKSEKHKAKPAMQIYCIKCKYLLDNKYSSLKCPRCTYFKDYI